MQDKRAIKIIDIMIIVIGLISILVLLATLFNNSLMQIIDINLVPIILISAYTGLTGIKIFIKGNRQLGLYLFLFSLIVIATRIFLMIAFS